MENDMQYEVNISLTYENGELTKEEYWTQRFYEGYTGRTVEQTWSDGFKAIDWHVFVGTQEECQQYMIENSPERMGKKFKVRTLTLDTSDVDVDWDDYPRGYSCPVIVVPAHFCSRIKWDIVNHEYVPQWAKINGHWYNVHTHNTGRVGEHREPANYPNTRINKVMTTSELSRYFSWSCQK